MDDVVQWVSDKLHEILGLSDKFTAEFLVGLAKSSNSSNQFVQKLEKTDAIAISPAVVSFANELWSKVPHRQPREKPARQREREIIREQERNRQYKLLSDSEEDIERTHSARDISAKKKKSKFKSKQRHLRTQKTTAIESDEEEEERRVSEHDSDLDEWERYMYINLAVCSRHDTSSL